LFLTIVLVTLLTLPSTAATISFTGSFQLNSDVHLFQFSIASQSQVVMRSHGFAGGTNAAGTTIPEGGFDTVFSLYDSTGLRIGFNDDGGCDYVNANSFGSCNDSYLDFLLEPGSYVLALTQYDNYPLDDLASGFYRDGQGNFAGGFETYSPDWAVDIENVDDAGTIERTPEPASLLLVGLGAGMLALLRRR
jgi:hypothetical protein